MVTSREGGFRTDPLRTISNSVTLLIATVGIVLITIGYILNDGVWPAMLAIWGSAMLIGGVSAYLLIWWKRQ